MPSPARSRPPAAPSPRAWTTASPATTRPPSLPNVRPGRRLGEALRRGVPLFLDGFPGRFSVSSVSCFPHVAILPPPLPRAGPRAARPGRVPAGRRVRDGAGAAPRRRGDGARDAEPAGRVLRLPARRWGGSAAHVEAPHGLGVGGPPGADRRPGAALGRPHARDRAATGGRLHPGRVGER